MTEEIVAEPVVEDAAEPVAEPTNWFDSAPETWRQDWVSKAGYDGDEAKTVSGMLDRVTDPGALLKNYTAAQEKIRKGQVSNGLPDDPSDEQLTAWREANGVPGSAEDYQLTLKDGLALSDNENEIFKDVFSAAHSKNISNEAMNELANSFKVSQARIIERQMAQDGIDSQQGAQVLKEAWQGDYQTNINMVSGLLNQLPESVRDVFKESRLADGRGMMNSPEVMHFFADIARKVNPAGTVVPNANNPTQAISDEIKALEARMGDREWFKDKAAQNRYQQLVTARQQMK